MEMQKTGYPRTDYLIDQEATEIRRLELFAARKARENKRLIEKFHDVYRGLQNLNQSQGEMRRRIG